MANKKEKTATLPPKPFTERELRASRFPRFEGERLMTTHGQLDELCSLIKTDHEEAALIIIERACQGHVDRNGPKPEGRMDTVLQQIAELKPESYLESMLISQMIQVYGAAGICIERVFLEGQGFKPKELYANLAIKFQRTFVAQIEALQKLRGKGGQRVTVEHVHVHEGGQAIVGNINHETGGRGKNEN